MLTRPLGTTAKALNSKAEKLATRSGNLKSETTRQGKKGFGRSLRPRSIKLLTRNPGQTWASARRLIERRIV